MNTSLVAIPKKVGSSSKRELILLGTIAAAFSASIWYSIFEDCERQIQKQKAFASGVAVAVGFTPLPPNPLEFPTVMNHLNSPDGPNPPKPVLIPIIEGDQVQPTVEMK
jgi:hypothetical protein